MANTITRPLPIPCPKCEHTGCALVVKSITIITVTCTTCAHTWATRLEWLPDDLERTVLFILSQL